MITQVLRHVTLSSHDADVKVDISRDTIYPCHSFYMETIVLPFSEVSKTMSVVKQRQITDQSHNQRDSTLS